MIVLPNDRETRELAAEYMDRLGVPKVIRHAPDWLAWTGAPIGFILMMIYRLTQPPENVRYMASLAMELMRRSQNNESRH